MKSQKKYMIGLLLFLSLGPRLCFSTMIDDFYSDEYVSAAIAHVGDMSLEELEFFISYIASCGTSTKSNVQKFGCERDKALFDMRYIHRNELTTLMSTLVVVEMQLESFENARAGSDERKELTKLLFRVVDILKRFREAATFYYAVGTDGAN